MTGACFRDWSSWKASASKSSSSVLFFFSLFSSTSMSAAPLSNEDVLTAASSSLIRWASRFFCPVILGQLAIRNAAVEWELQTRSWKGNSAICRFEAVLTQQCLKRCRCTVQRLLFWQNWHPNFLLYLAIFPRLHFSSLNYVSVSHRPMTLPHSRTFHCCGHRTGHIKGSRRRRFVWISFVHRCLVARQWTANYQFTSQVTEFQLEKWNWNINIYIFNLKHWICSLEHCMSTLSPNGLILQVLSIDRYILCLIRYHTCFKSFSKCQNKFRDSSASMANDDST